MKIYSINTGNFKLDGGAMFGVVPKTMWQKLNPPDENNLCNWAMRCLLIEDGNKLILIDTGIGNKQDAKFFSHYFLNGNDTLEKSLATHGFTKKDITDVVLTHLHFDHCGGSIEIENQNLQPAFSNAHYWSNQQHWQLATHPNNREKASFLTQNILPIAQSGQLKLIESPLNNSILTSKKIDTLPSEISENLSLKIVNGHTEAMMLPQIKYKENTIVFMADLLPSVAHLPLPYVMAYDMRPLETLVEKELFLQEAVANNYVLFFEHDLVNECCTLQQTDKGIRVDKIFNLYEL
jgi:glyoxylase-like metal-dependent hydrolase (beta-lactamase superfamily II)